MFSEISGISCRDQNNNNSCCLLFPRSGKAEFTVADIQRLFARMDFRELYHCALSQRSKYSHISSAVRSDSEAANISIFNFRWRRLYRLISQRRRSKAEGKWRVKSIVLSVMNVILCCSKSEHRRQTLLIDGQ